MASTLQKIERVVSAVSSSDISVTQGMLQITTLIPEYQLEKLHERIEQLKCDLSAKGIDADLLLLILSKNSGSTDVRAD